MGDQKRGLKDGESANVATTIESIYVTVTGEPTRAGGLPIEGIVRMFSTDAGNYYRLDGEDAAAAAPSTLLPSSLERYENIRPGKLQVQNKGFSVFIAAGTVQIDIIV